MVLGDADMGGHPKRTGLGWRLDPCFTLFHLDLKVSMNKENMCLGWKSELPRGQFGSSGRYAPLGTKLPSGQFRFPSSAHIFWVPSHVRIAEDHKY